MHNNISNHLYQYFRVKVGPTTILGEEIHNPIQDVNKSYAVYMREVSKNYGTKGVMILDNLNLSIPQGTLYVIMGASGSGKSTLLSCMVGSSPMDLGHIWIFGKPIGHRAVANTVGYMPQNISLYGEFTIKETLLYFGWINGMKHKVILKRYQELIAEFSLPQNNPQVKKLSLGQQRRISFIASLVNKPNLLVLDEPTIGEDPHIRHQIWSYLQKIVKNEKKTVVVATHYMEEAENSDFIGILRDGKIRAEGPPKKLLQTYACNNMLTLFTKLCKEPMADDPSLDEEQRRPSKTMTSKSINCTKLTTFMRYMCRQVTCDSLHVSRGLCYIMLALSMKNFLRIVRHRSLFSALILLPILLSILFCTSADETIRHKHYIAVNGENPNDPETCKANNACTTTHLCCHMFNFFKQHQFMFYYSNTREQALDKIRRADVINHKLMYGMVICPENFSRELLHKYESNSFSKNLITSRVVLSLDMTSGIYATVFGHMLRDTFYNFISDWLTSCNYKAEFMRHGLFNIDESIDSDDAIYLKIFVKPAMKIFLIFFLSLVLCAPLIFVERTDGLLARSILLGASPVQIMFSYIIIHYVITMIQVFAVLISINLICPTHRTKLTYAILLIILQGNCGMLCGIVISAVTTTVAGLVHIILALFFILLLCSGIIWPTEIMPHYLETVCMYLPLTRPIKAARLLTTKDIGFFHYDIYIAFISSGVWILLLMIISLVTFAQESKRKRIIHRNFK